MLSYDRRDSNGGSEVFGSNYKGQDAHRDDISGCMESLAM